MAQYRKILKKNIMLELFSLLEEYQALYFDNSSLRQIPSAISVIFKNGSLMQLSMFLMMLTVNFLKEEGESTHLLGV